MRPVMARMAPVLAMVGLLLALAGCRSAHAYYLGGVAREDRGELKKLFHLLEKEEEPGENRFILLQQIANRLRRGSTPEKLILFLTHYVERTPTDPYNAYYLALVAEAYKESGAWPLAIHYYDRILLNHPDLLIRGASLHFRCLQELIGLQRDPRERLHYYKELISRFSDSIDPGVTYYLLARAYEEVGEWEQAIQVYQKFLTYPDTEVPGYPNAQARARELVEFHYSDKSWTVEDLQQLVAEIRSAIRARDSRRLLRYRAKVNFFTLSWSQDEGDENVALTFDIASFLQTSRVIASDELDIDSNAGEAYLYTTRWTYRIPTWYLYFRKVDFKADPEINGRWEWAGIYFGEKL